MLNLISYSSSYMKKITIAIDGYSGTGKGTTSRGVAEELWYIYLDTGAMYRAATLIAIREEKLDASAEEKVAMLRAHALSFVRNTETWNDDIYVDGENVESLIRTTALAMQMKPIVTCIPLREEMVRLQQNFWTVWGIVCDGRDTATHIFPDAQLKVFMICDVETRARRRYAQLVAWWHEADLEAITTEIELRDQTDYLWPAAVNKKHPDAKVLDTTHLSIDEQIAQVVQWAREVWA